MNDFLYGLDKNKEPFVAFVEGQKIFYFAENSHFVLSSP